jgi:GNAT superfamily N-acetyltransferase
MQIREVISREEIMDTFNVLAQIYGELSPTTYTENVLSMMQDNYRMAAVYEDVGTCIGVIGLRFVRKLHHGRAVEIEDFMIDRKKRGIGVGKMLMRWAEFQAAAMQCKSIIGSLETKRLESQRIFSREGFILDGFFFKKGK